MIYRIKLPFATLYMRANLAEASASIDLASESSGVPSDRDFSAIGNVTGDARHDPMRAAVLARAVGE